MSDKPYLSASIEFLDRDKQTVKVAMCYPITKITLHQRMHAANPEGRPWREFRVGDSGEVWVEVQ